MRERDRSIDEHPVAVARGVLDEFFDGKLAPLLETNRGCPFQCTFCVQGVRWYTKVHYFSKDRGARRDRLHRAAHQRVCPSMGFLADRRLELTGMFEAATSKSRATSAQRGSAMGWPTYIDATTGKNRRSASSSRSRRRMPGWSSTSRCSRSTRGRLKNIKRSNISREAYEQVMIHVRGRGLRSLSDLILGLPGETLATYLAGIDQLLDAGTNEMQPLPGD